MLESEFIKRYNLLNSKEVDLGYKQEKQEYFIEWIECGCKRTLFLESLRKNFLREIAYMLDFNYQISFDQALAGEDIPEEKAKYLQRYLDLIKEDEKDNLNF